MITFLSFHNSYRALSLGRLVSSIAAMVVWVAASAAVAQQSFKTPEQAVEVLAAAANADDMNGVITVLGRNGRDIIVSGDAVADRSAKASFLSSYNDKHKIVLEGDKTAILMIGQQDWPFPIPLVRDGDQWKFDTAKGREEILYRRIGRNELNTIEACLAYVDAQNEYASMNEGTYAQRIVSRPGKKDGLYWPTEPGAPPSPLGPLVADASAAGYTVGQKRAPYHGYYYKILTAQGASAPGGEIDYVVRGKMIGGFGLVAYPAEYGNSGVMTFIVNHAGEVFQRDLGRKTALIVSRMTEFQPDRLWRKAETATAKAN